MYNPEYLERPYIVVFNKIDIPTERLPNLIEEISRIRSDVVVSEIEGGLGDERAASRRSRVENDDFEDKLNRQIEKDARLRKNLEYLGAKLKEIEHDIEESRLAYHAVVIERDNMVMKIKLLMGEKDLSERAYQLEVADPADSVQSELRILRDIYEPKQLDELGKVMIIWDPGDSIVVVAKVTINVLIYGFCKEGKIEEALIFGQEMASDCFYPNISTFNSLIQGLCLTINFNMAMESSGCARSVITFNILIDGFCKSKKIEGAEEILPLLEKSTHLTVPLLLIAEDVSWAGNSTALFLMVELEKGKIISLDPRGRGSSSDGGIVMSGEWLKNISKGGVEQSWNWAVEFDLRMNNADDGLKHIRCKSSSLDPRGRGSFQRGSIVMDQCGGDDECSLEKKKGKGKLDVAGRRLIRVAKLKKRSCYYLKNTFVY